jgi:N-acetylglucosaminyl-diphospho-decaprenol L-rhamnosyltransferase
VKVLTVIVNYRCADYTLRAVESVLPQLDAIGDAAVWIVENASPDDSLRTLQTGISERGWGKRARIIASSHNGGFGYGNNVAIREALALPSPPEYIYLLNPDAVVDPGAVQTLVAFLDAHPRSGIAGSFVHEMGGATHASSFRFPSLWSELESGLRLGIVTALLRHHVVSMAPPSEDQPVDWVTGASSMLRTRMLREIGLFDEEFFLYFEETDLCRRARHAGWEVWFVRAASAGHVQAVSTGMRAPGRRPTFWFESRARYWRKHHGRMTLCAANAIWASAFALHRALAFLRGRRGSDPALLRDFLLHSWRPLLSTR